VRHLGRAADAAEPRATASEELAASPRIAAPMTTIHTAWKRLARSAAPL
jgi:hypothetical protein